MWQYNYVLRDHLGNTRVTFADTTGNGLIDPTIEIAQINHYYPFGLNMEGNWNGASPYVKNKYQYNDKELQTDFGLNWNDYGARFYDPAIGRWLSPDPLAEKYYRWSPYNYCVDNPINYTDPTGMSAMPGKDKNEAEESNNQFSKGIEMRQFVDKALKAKTDSHWDSENGGSENGGNEEEQGGGSYEDYAKQLNQKDAKLNAGLASNDHILSDDEPYGMSEPLNGTGYVNKNFVDAVKKASMATVTDKNVTVFSGTLAIWLDPKVNQSGVAKQSEIPEALRGKGTVTTEMIKTYMRIVKLFNANGVKIGNGANGTMKLLIRILPETPTAYHRKVGPSYQRNNFVIWIKPGGV